MEDVERDRDRLYRVRANSALEIRLYGRHAASLHLRDRDRDRQSGEARMRSTRAIETGEQESLQLPNQTFPDTSIARFIRLSLNVYRCSHAVFLCVALIAAHPDPIFRLVGDECWFSVEGLVTHPASRAGEHRKR
jgi:hypothetical protein